jgi:hypothetical protein
VIGANVRLRGYRLELGPTSGDLLTATSGPWRLARRPTTSRLEAGVGKNIVDGYSRP